MKSIYILTLSVLLSFFGKSQTYFPPLTGTTWETTDPSSLGWCQDSIDVMYDWLEQTDSKAFIVLKNGKIVLEKYFGTFTADSFYVWNSAGKTLTAYAVGIAQKEGFLDINDPTSDYLGSGWTSLTSPQENAITIQHQLTMTTGLDDGVSDIYCTDPSCLTYLSAPGTRWAYHNGPYTLLDSVIESATGINLNMWVNSKIASKIGMTGLYVQSGYNNVFVSKPRSMARFGLLLSQNGFWNTTEVLDDLTYLDAMRTPSQTLNNSYGYLTWLNGQSSFMIPQTQFVFPGALCPNAPADMYAAEGKNGQIINVVPSDNIVLVRMGSTMGNSLVGTQYNDTIWQYMNRLTCGLSIGESLQNKVTIHPNPSASIFHLEGIDPTDDVLIRNCQGSLVYIGKGTTTFQANHLEKGMYLVEINKNNHFQTLRIVVE
jgi:CubicO group peptidase (beta-lactamase class C family)